MPRGGKRTGAGRTKGSKNKIKTSDKGRIEVSELARQYTGDAMNALAEIVNDKGSGASARVAAASVLLDRGYGKAKQPLEHTLDLDALPDEEFRAIHDIARAIAGANH